jgi:hypothetical protein
MPYEVDGESNLIAKTVIAQGADPHFFPARPDRQLRPKILKVGGPQFDDMVRYMEWTSEGFAHRFAQSRATRS